MIGTDIFGSFNLLKFEGEYLGDKGNFLKITDVYLKYTRIYFSEKILAEEVSKFLNNWKDHFAKPIKIISDNGPQYVIKVVRITCKIRGSDRLLIPAYYPQSNGVSERINKKIAEVLRMNRGLTIKGIIERIEH